MGGRKPNGPESFWSKVDRSGGPNTCWIWLGLKDRQGYPRISLMNRSNRGGRYVFFLSHGRWPQKSILHSCDRPDCLNPKHLREGSDKDNHFDRVSRERYMIPCRQITAIREMIRGGISVPLVAHLYGVSEQHIGRIRDRKSRAYCD